jgi:hypothetical protein
LYVGTGPDRTIHEQGDRGDNFIDFLLVMGEGVDVDDLPGFKKRWRLNS